jgi:DNA repair exonuclease SbcCD ATPase subunit
MLRFHTLRWKNFLSTGNVFTEIQLDRSPNTIITGDNGAGKSTILDALCYVLFNKPFRNINKPQLLNSINGKDCVAEIEFSISNNQYKVVRGLKPAVFEIYKNGKLIDQPGNARDYQTILEETILKLTYKSFTQIVVLGNASFTPFMQLSTRDRRDVIEDLLDIQIFSSMNKLLKDRISENKKDINDVEYQIDLDTEKATVNQEYLNRVKQDLTKQIDEVEEDIASLTELYNTTKQNSESVKEHIEKIKDAISNSDSVASRRERIEEVITKLKSRTSKLKKRKLFFETNEHCPTCEQSLEKEVRDAKVAASVDQLAEVEQAMQTVQGKYDKLMKEVERIEGGNTKLRKKSEEYRALVITANGYLDQITKLKEKKLKLTAEETVDDTVEQTLRDLKKSIKNNKAKKEQLLSDKELLGVAAALLKDGGIKSKIIRQYVPIINKLVNKYLSSLDFFVNFELDEEFNEILRSRHRDEFSYSSFSEGEKMRIDLALLFTWRAVAKLKNSTNTNLLILDEVFDASLDAAGCDEFLKLLQEVGAETNVFVISHKGDILIDKFRSQIRFEKVKNFSRIAV